MNNEDFEKYVKEMEKRITALEQLFIPKDEDDDWILVGEFSIEKGWDGATSYKKWQNKHNQYETKFRRYRDGKPIGKYEYSRKLM